MATWISLVVAYPLRAMRATLSSGMTARSCKEKDANVLMAHHGQSKPLRQVVEGGEGEVLGDHSPKSLGAEAKGRGLH